MANIGYKFNVRIKLMILKITGEISLKYLVKFVGFCCFSASYILHNFSFKLEKYPCIMQSMQPSGARLKFQSRFNMATNRYLGKDVYNQGSAWQWTSIFNYGGCGGF